MHSSQLTTILEQSAARHSHLCPRQVLGARIGLAGAAELGLDIPRQDKRLLVIVETDGCFVDGIEIATGCTMGHRTLRLEDYGKVAATFVDIQSEYAVRVFPHPDVRQRASFYLPDEKRHYLAQLKAYQVMPNEELLSFQQIHLVSPLRDLISRPGVRVNCMVCREEIINEREVVRHGLTLCASCAGLSYYQAAIPQAVPAPFLEQPLRLTV